MSMSFSRASDHPQGGGAWRRRRPAWTALSCSVNWLAQILGHGASLSVKNSPAVAWRSGVGTRMPEETSQRCALALLWEVSSHIFRRHADGRRHHRRRLGGPRPPRALTASAPRRCANGARPAPSRPATGRPSSRPPACPWPICPAPRDPRRPRAIRAATDHRRATQARPPPWFSATARSSGAAASAPIPGDAAPVGEVCFNTGMTGYQETLTDPSYAGQIITFTFPHIGNVGTNAEDIEAATIAARGLVVKQDVTEPSNWRSTQHLDAWLQAPGRAGHRRHRHPRADHAHPRWRRAERRAGFPADGRFDLRGAARPGRRPGRGWRAWTWPRRSPAGSPMRGTRRNGPGRPASAGRPRRSTRSSRWITGRSATSCAAWPPPAAG